MRTPSNCGMKITFRVVPFDARLENMTVRERLVGLQIGEEDARPRQAIPKGQL